MLTFKQFLRESLDDKDLKSLKFRFYKTLASEIKKCASYYKTSNTTKLFVDAKGKDLVVKIFSNKYEIFGVKRAVRQTLESFYAKKEADKWYSNTINNNIDNFDIENLKVMSKVKDTSVTMELTINSDIFDYGESKVSVDDDTITLVAGPNPNDPYAGFDKGAFEKAFKSVKTGEPFACPKDGNNFLIKGPNDTVVCRYFLRNLSGNKEAVIVADFRKLKADHFSLFDRLSVRSSISFDLINKLKKAMKFSDGNDNNFQYRSKNLDKQDYWDHLASFGSKENTVMAAFGIKMDSYRYSAHMYVTEKYLDDLCDTYRVDADKFESIKKKIKVETEKLTDKCLNMLHKVDNELKDKEIRIV